MVNIAHADSVFIGYESSQDILSKETVCIRINSSGREIFQGEQFASFPNQFNVVSMYYITISESFSIDSMNSDNEAEDVLNPNPELPRHCWEVMLMGNYQKDALGRLHNPSLFVPNYCYRLDSPKNRIISLEQIRTFFNQSFDSFSENLKRAENSLFFGLTNIYDPEGLRHYVYFPMQIIKNGLLEYHGMKVFEREAETFRNTSYCAN